MLILPVLQVLSNGNVTRKLALIAYAEKPKGEVNDTFAEIKRTTIVRVENRSSYRVTGTKPLAREPLKA